MPQKHYTDYDVAYAFIIKGDTIEGLSGVSAVEYGLLTLGEHVDVVYQPSSPENSQMMIAMQTGWAHPWQGFIELSFMLIGFAVAFAAAIFIPMERRFLKERYLLKMGITCIS